MAQAACSRWRQLVNCARRCACRENHTKSAVRGEPNALVNGTYDWGRNALPAPLRDGRYGWREGSRRCTVSKSRPKSRGRSGMRVRPLTLLTATAAVTLVVAAGSEALVQAKVYSLPVNAPVRVIPQRPAPAPPQSAALMLEAATPPQEPQPPQALPVAGRPRCRPASSRPPRRPPRAAPRCRWPFSIAAPTSWFPTATARSWAPRRWRSCSSPTTCCCTRPRARPP